MEEADRDCLGMKEHPKTVADLVCFGAEYFGAPNRDPDRDGDTADGDASPSRRHSYRNADTDRNADANGYPHTNLNEYADAYGHPGACRNLA